MGSRTQYYAEQKRFNAEYAPVIYHGYIPETHKKNLKNIRKISKKHRGKSLADLEALFKKKDRKKAKKNANNRLQTDTANV